MKILYGVIALFLLVIAAVSANGYVAFGSFSEAVKGARSAEFRTISGYYGVGALLSLVLSVVFLYAAWRAPRRGRAQEL
jgi:hypothetical protein